MATDINVVVANGNLVRDPEISTTPGGASVCKFSIANNRTFSTSGEKKNRTSFFNCIAWGKLGELINEYCRKGHRLAIRGRLQQRSWEDTNGAKRYAVEIVVEECQFLELKGNGATEQGDGVKRGPGVPDDVPSFNEATPFTDDDILF